MKKRILSLILALSMVLSVFPLGAFAEGFTQDLVMQNGYPVGSIGDGWSYDNNTQTLTLTRNSGKYDFSYTYPQNPNKGVGAEPVKCAIEIQWSVEITGGTFNETVTNEGTIKNGSFAGRVTSNGTIMDNGTFNGTVTNSGYIKDGTFKGKVTNSNTIENGTFKGSVTNEGTIKNGSFEKKVTNSNTIMDGVFKGVVENGGRGTIFGGTFAGSVNNSYGGHIFGGVFNGHINVPGFGVYPITVDEASSKAKIVEVNDVSADWAPYVVVTELTKNQKVIITADTDIFSLNGKPIGAGNCNSSYGVDKKTVKFTMPNENVVLGTGDLVMENGLPDCPVGTMGNGWEYRNGTLYLTSGTFDFSSPHPQNKTGTQPAPAVACAIVIFFGVEMTGGTFNKTVANNGGTIKNGTFEGTVENYFGGTISNGIFNGTVTNRSTIENGTFEGTVENYYEGKISDGTFEGEVKNKGTISDGTFQSTSNVINEKKITGGKFEGTVMNNTGRTISGGTFRGKVDNSGNITGGIFAAGLSKNDGSVTGGIFNGKTGLTDALQVTVTNGSVSQVNNEGPLNADGTPGTAWDLYAYAGTPMTIIASTEIFSLNGQPIAESSYGVDKTTVTFTMPDDDVVLNKAITSTDLVMENGYPKDSNGGKNPCKGDGWEYIKNDPTNGDMLLLTGSNQTGGLFDFSTIGDGAAVECNVFVGRPTAITGGEFNGKVFNNSGILGGTFHGEVDNRAPGIIKGGTFNGAVENNGIIEKGTFNGAVTNSGTVSESITGSGTLNGELITKTPEPKPEPTTYTVTVIGGTIDGKTSVSAKENDTLTVVLDQNDIPDGMTFDLWSISSNKLSGDINVDYRAEAMTFQMPAEDVTIRAQYRSAEIIEDAAPSPLATAATIAVGGAAAGIVVWQGVSLGVDLYLANALPQGVPVPTDRRALALLLWETAGKPEVALPTLYGDIPTEEIELQKATRWAVQNGLMDAADKKDASFFDPDHYVTKMDVFGAWLRLKKLLGTT